MNSTDLRYYLSIFLRRLPLFLVVCILITAAGLYVALILPPVFRATSNILVQSPQIVTDIARLPLGGDTISRIQVIERELTTREALMDLASRFGVYPSQEMPTDAEIVADMRGRISLELVGGEQGALGLAVSFEAQDPHLAATVANGIAADILERDAANRSSQASDTLAFFQGEVARLAASVAQIEQRIEAYKTENLDALPDSLEFRRTQQSNLQERLLILEREEASLRNRRANYSELYRSSGQVGDISQTPEQKLLENLRIALTTQRAMFVEGSPNIAALEARIAAVDAQMRESSRTAGTGAAGQPSPLDLQLAEIDDRLRAIDLEKSLIAGSLESLGTSIAATPANEVTLNALKREYDNEQTLYNAALARLAEAATGEQIETRFKGERLSLLEAAVPPENPVRPKRTLIALGAAAAGAGLGLAAIVLLEILLGRVRRPVQLHKVLGIEPLATIPYIRTHAQIWRRRIIAGLAVTVLLISLPVIDAMLASNGTSFGTVMMAALSRVGALVS